jgi:hypothetical protein
MQLLGQAEIRPACSRADDDQYDFNTTSLALKAARVTGGFLG